MRAVLGWGQGNSCKSGDRGAAPSHLSLGSSHLPRLHLGTTEAGVGPCGSPVLKWTCRCRNVNCKAGGLLPPAALPHPRASNPKLCSPLLSPWASQGRPLPRREPLSSHLLVFYLKMNTGCVKCVRRQASRSSSSREPAGGKEGRQTPPEGGGKRGTTGLRGPRRRSVQNGERRRWARAPARSLPPGRASALTLRGDRGGGDGAGVRPTLSLSLPPSPPAEPDPAAATALPSLSFPHKRALRCRSRRRTRVPPFGPRSRMTSRSGQPRLRQALGKAAQFPAPPPQEAQGACADGPPGLGRPSPNALFSLLTEEG